MRKLLFVTTLLALTTACPQVERKIYTFDLKAHTGTLVFENVVTDDPKSANDDFMQIVTQVIKGTKIEEDHTGWSVSKKALFENNGRLDGKVEFTFGSVSGAGIYQHDKKAPLVWCTSRDEQETIVSTNGTRIPELPGCIAWDRKATNLTITVRTADLSGGEQPLVDQWKKWSAGETLPVSQSGSTGLGASGNDLGAALAEQLKSGMAASLAGNADLVVGDPVVTGGSPDDAAALGDNEKAGLKLCLAGAAAAEQAVKETVEIAVKPDGTWSLAVKDSSAPDADRAKCYEKALSDATFPKHDAAWTIAVPLAVTAPK